MNPAKTRDNIADYIDQAHVAENEKEQLSSSAIGVLGSAFQALTNRDLATEHIPY